MVSLLEPEIIYYPKLERPKEGGFFVTLAKFEDGEFKKSYKIEGNKCNCPGCVYHKTQCKHLRLVKSWAALDFASNVNFKEFGGQFLVQLTDQEETRIDA